MDVPSFLGENKAALWCHVLHTSVSFIIIIVIQPDGIFDPTGREKKLWPCDDGSLVPPPVCRSQGMSIFSSSSTRTSSSAMLLWESASLVKTFMHFWCFHTSLHSTTPFLLCCFLFFLKKHFNAEFSGFSFFVLAPPWPTFHKFLQCLDL